MSDKRATATTSLKYWEIVGHRQYLRDIQERQKLFKGQYRAEIETREVVGAKPGLPARRGCHSANKTEDLGEPVRKILECDAHEEVCRLQYGFAALLNSGQIPVARKDLGMESVGTLILEENPLVVLPQIPSVGEFVVCIDCCCPILNPKFAQCCSCLWPVCKDDACDPNVSLHTGEECDILATSRKDLHWKQRAGYECLWMIRILLQKKINPETYELITNIEAKDECLKDDGIRGRYFALEMLRSMYDIDQKEFSDKELIHIWNLLRVKLFHSFMAANAVFKKAKMLYKEGSMFLHSCLANVSVETDANFRLRLFLQRPVSAGEHLTINYDSESVFQPTRSRQIRFNQFYKFRCLCLRCEDPTELGNFFSGIPCHSSKTCEDLNSPGYLLQKELKDPGSKWECSKCHQVELSNTEVQSWLYSITRGLEECLKRQAEPEALNLLVENIVNQQVLHETHHVIFEYNVETLKLLSKQLENDPSIGTAAHLMKYWRAARSVSKICRSFLPAGDGVNVVGPVLRMCAVIKMAGLVMGFQEKNYNLSRVKQDLDRYVLRLDEGGNLVLRNGPLLLSQNDNSDQLDRVIMIALVNCIDKCLTELEPDASSRQNKVMVINDLQLYASYLRKYFYPRI